MQRWRVRVAVRGADDFDAGSFLPRLFGEELPHLDASFAVEEHAVVVTATAVAPDGGAAGRYVEGRITASLRKRELPWIAAVVEVSPITE